MHSKSLINKTKNQKKKTIFLIVVKNKYKSFTYPNKQSYTDTHTCIMNKPLHKLNRKCNKKRSLIKSKKREKRKGSRLFSFTECMYLTLQFFQLFYFLFLYFLSTFYFRIYYWRAVFFIVIVKNNNTRLHIHSYILVHTRTIHIVFVAIVLYILHTNYVWLVCNLLHRFLSKPV